MSACIATMVTEGESTYSILPSRCNVTAAVLQARQENEEARSTAAERLDELKARIESRDRLLQEEQVRL